MMEIDDNADGMISLDEMRSEENTEVLKTMINSLALPIGFTSTDMFEMLNEDGGEELSSEMFLRDLFRLLSSNDFQRFCMNRVSLNQIKQRILKIEGRFDKLESRFDDQDQQSKAIISMLEKNSNEQDRQWKAIIAMLGQLQPPKKNELQECVMVKNMASRLSHEADSPRAPEIPSVWRRMTVPSAHEGMVLEHFHIADSPLIGR
eukprot:gnl/TRDRNA2_/TRDRNA2_209111_c0_seq1.p1 gnl/TRDRNA2_/TRDRNA2_209111_c0~~gnl/TRDRNA2_/TRDRNA2_209111_c0_seq1.p1  ORF type:complete len:221 (+),score=57.11 gnl/TRDRNA2_/TRDRNA2_209111_c0_seq1:51-665(+)